LATGINGWDLYCSEDLLPCRRLYSQTPKVNMIAKKDSKQSLLTQIENKLKTVYDPEFPMVDIFTLGLIYKVEADEIKRQVQILMTFTTPACPMAEMIQELIRNAVLEVVPDFKINIEITFEPMRTYNMIKDEDLKRMFE
jgi:metal-sulfur cluster biosynthetic enzyme